MSNSKRRFQSAGFNARAWRLATSLLVCLVLGLSPAPATAQSKQPPRPKSGLGAAPFKLPHTYVLTKMIQSHMSALSHAIITNNYSVLRDLGTPGFRKANSTAKLARIFKRFRTKGLDITVVVLYSPIVQHTPKVDQKGWLRLRGYYPTKPQRIYFDLIFVPAARRWRLHGISARVAPPPKTAAKGIKPVLRTVVSALNVRDAPSLSGKLLTTLQPGHKVTLIGQGNGKSWRRVQIAPNAFGYIKTTVLMANSK